MNMMKNGYAKGAVIAAVRAYKKLVSPYIIKSCRFHPTCSEYAVQALERYGLFRGAGKAIWRVLRCNPFSAGGYDPVDGVHTGKGY